MLSIIAVNYNSSALLKECFSSVISTIGNEPFEFLVIDSGSREEDVNNLWSLKDDDVTIVLNRGNIGYAKAVNMGIRSARGDVILITNPDVVYTPDSMSMMMRALSELPRCGAVGPKTWWDREMTFLLPFSELVTPYTILRTELMGISRTVRSTILRGWIRKALGYWRSEKPVMQEMLSGACIMTTRKTIDAVGGFDESFPLYFEDTDWCLRVRRAGFLLHMVPQAHIIHYYNQSAKQDTVASQERFNDSLDKYLKKHFRCRTSFLHKVLRSRNFAFDKAPALFNDLGVLYEPPVFPVQNGLLKLFLMSPVDSLIPSAGSFFAGNSFEIPRDLWDRLGEGRYFVKVFGLDRFEDYGTWSWIKACRYESTVGYKVNNNGDTKIHGS